MSTSCKCGATWSGHRIEHCTACHETFTGTTSGDRHRVGEHSISVGPDRRRCLTPHEMRDKGLVQNARGYWTNGGTSPWSAPQSSPASAGPGGHVPGAGEHVDHPGAPSPAPGGSTSLLP